jgi:SET domain-containing protein
VLNPKIKKGNSLIEGAGLFAIEKIKKDEIIWFASSEYVLKISVEDFNKLESSKQESWIKHSYQIGNMLYMDIDDTRLMNHSCNPNVVDKGEVCVAKRDIESGEEITWDYTPYMNPVQTFECKCGSKNCVGIVKKGVYKGNDALQKVSY